MKKVFCIGFQKTGTTSMETALGLLGLNVTSVFGRDLDIDTLESSYVARGLTIAQEADAVQDMPWPLLFRDLDAAFPEARFILTTRDEDAWWRSILGHFGKNVDVMQQLVYGRDAGAPLGHENRYRQVYRDHNAAVRAHFRDRPGKLLELDFSSPVGWPELCAFLEIPEPAIPFPKSNQPKQYPSLKRALRRRALHWANALMSSRSG